MMTAKERSPRGVIQHSIWIALVLLNCQPLTLVAQFTGHFPDPTLAASSATISIDSTHVALTSDQGQPTLSVQFKPASTTPSDIEQFDIGSLQVVLGEGISVSEIVNLTLNIQGAIAPFEEVALDLPFRFRLRSATSPKTSTLQLLHPSALPIIEQDGNPFALEIELVTKSDDPEAIGSTDAVLAPGNQIFRPH